MKMTTKGWLLLISIAAIVLAIHKTDEKCAKELAARVVEAEARGESFCGKYFVASVIVNRLDDDRFPNTVAGVVYEPNQFAAPSDTFSEDAMLAVECAWRSPRKNLIFFFNKKKATNKKFIARRTGCFTFENHTFCSN